MADTIGTVRVELIADPSGIQRGIEQASESLQRVAAVGAFVGNVLAEAFIRVGEKFAELASELAEGKGDVWDKLSDNGQRAVSAIVQGLQGMQDTFATVAAELIDRVGPAFAHLVQQVSDLGANSALLRTIFEGVVFAIKAVVSVAITAVATIRDLFSSLEALGAMAARIAQTIGEVVANAFSPSKAAEAWRQGMAEIGTISEDVNRRNEAIWADAHARIAAIWSNSPINADKIVPEVEKVGGSLRRLEEQARRVFEATRTPLERFAVEVGKLQTLLSKGLIDQDTFNRAVEMANDKISGLRDTMRSLAQSVSGAFTDAILGAKSFGEAVRGLLQDIARLLLNKVFMQLLLGAGGGTQGPVGGLFGSLFSGGRAGGGSVSAGRLYAVGERGPELFMPSMAGTIIPNDAISAGGGGDMKVTVNNYSDNGVDVQRRSDGELEVTIRALAADEMSKRGGRGALSNAYGVRPRVRARG